MDHAGDEHSEQRYRRGLLVLVAVVALVTLLRSFDAIVWPTLYSEDGRDVFAYYRNRAGAGEILKSYAGYVALFPNLVGYVSAQLPATLAPYLLTGTAVLLTIAARSVFALSLFRFVMPSDRGRQLVCLALTLAPVGSLRLTTLVSYSIWNLLFLLLMLAWAPAPATVKARLARFPLLVVAALSHPLAVVALPLLGRNLVLRRRPLDRVLNGSLAALIVGYLFVGVSGGAGKGVSIVTAIVGSPVLFAERVVFEPLFGTALRDQFSATGQRLAMWLTAAAILLVVGRFAHAAWKRGDLRWTPLATLVVGAVGLTVLACIGRGIDPTADPGPWNHRYVYVPQLLMLLVAGVAVVQGVRWTELPRSRTAVAAVVIVGGLVLANIHSHRFHDTDREDGERVAAFLEQVDRTPEDAHVLERTKKGLWTIALESGGVATQVGSQR